MKHFEEYIVSASTPEALDVRYAIFYDVPAPGESEGDFAHRCLHAIDEARKALSKRISASAKVRIQVLADEMRVSFVTRSFGRVAMLTGGIYGRPSFTKRLLKAAFKLARPHPHPGLIPPCRMRGMSSWASAGSAPSRVSVKAAGPSSPRVLREVVED